jgi:hypothetical protein
VVPQPVRCRRQPHLFADLSSGNPARPTIISESPPDTALRFDTTRNEFPAVGTYKKLEARTQVPVNFQEMRASGPGFKSSGNSVRAGG